MYVCREQFFAASNTLSMHFAMEMATIDQGTFPFMGCRMVIMGCIIHIGVMKDSWCVASSRMASMVAVMQSAWHHSG
jgi:hypothetical protein